MMDGKKASAKENQRTCKHNHGGKARNASMEELPAAPPSPIQEETNGEVVAEADILILDDDRTMTSGSVDVKVPYAGFSSRPLSRRLDSRSGSRASGGRSTFEQLPGTRPASRRTISRSSNRSRRSQPESAGSHLYPRGGHSSDSDSDDDVKGTNHIDLDLTTVDIHDEKAFDTDLEVEAGSRLPHVVDGILDFQSVRLAYLEQASKLQRKTPTSTTPNTTTTYDHSGKTSYIDTCKKLGVVPASYFLRHMHDPHLNMSHHGLGPVGMRALSEALTITEADHNELLKSYLPLTLKSQKEYSCFVFATSVDPDQKSNTHVLELDLCDNWLGPHGGLAVCEMLKENCFITNLNLSDNRLGNACAPHICLIMQSNVTLTHITLAGNEFDDNCALHFAEALLNTTKVQYLDLSHNSFGDVAGTILGPAIADNTCVKELDLSWNCIRRKGAVAICQGLKNNVYMKVINLSWNGFGLEGSIGLQDALKANTVLEELDISNNRITTEGAVLIGKSLSLNETLQVLKIGQNPMQSAGCYGICAAILRNPNCVIKRLDFSDILVNKDFEDIYKQVLEQLPTLSLKHGGMEPPQKPKAPVHPMVKLANYIEKHELRLVDFFNKFDKDGSMSVTHEEFVEGIEETGIKLSEDEVQLLLEELDRDGDGEINYNELVVSHTDFQEKREQINTVLTVMQPRPMTT